MLQEEIALHNFRRRLGLCGSILTNIEGRLLLRIIALAAKNELLGRILNLHDLAQCVHIANNLLKVRGGHRDDTRELNGRNRDGLDIQLNQIQREPRGHLLLAIQDFEPQLCSVLLVHEENDALVVRNRLDELEEVNHINAENVLLGAVELVEPVGLETQMHQNRVSPVHRHDFETRAVELDIGVRQNVLNGFDKCAKGGGLDSAASEEHVGGFHLLKSRGFAFKWRNLGVAFVDVSP